MSPSDLQRRALLRALANGGASAVVRVRYGSYRVTSATRPGTAHRVSVIGANYFCSCEAGVAGRPCHHAASVYIAKVEAGGGRVTGPATPLPAIPANVTPISARRAA